MNPKFPKTFQLVILTFLGHLQDNDPLVVVDGYIASMNSINPCNPAMGGIAKGHGRAQGQGHEL